MTSLTSAAQTSQLAAIDWERNTSDWISTAGEFLGRFLLFVAILVVGWIVAKVVLKAVNAFLERVGFDALVERGGIKQALARSNYDASDVVAKLAYYAVLLLVLTLAFRVFGPNNPISEMLTAVVSYLPNIIVAIVIIVVTAAIAKAIKDLVATLLSSTFYGRFLAIAASVIIMVIGVLGAFDQLEIMPEVTVIIAAALINGLVWFVFATLGGILIVGLGGGLVLPMSKVWTEWIGTIREKAPELKAKAQGSSAASTTEDNDPMRGYVANQAPTEE